MAETGQEDWDRAGRLRQDRKALIQGRKAETGQKDCYRAEMLR